MFRTQNKQLVTCVLIVMVLFLMMPLIQLYVTQTAFAETNLQEAQRMVSDKSAVDGDLSCSFHSTENSAKSDIRTVVTTRSKYKGKYNCERYSTFYFDVANLSQTSLNSIYNSNHQSDQISGTCSLVAMTMLVNAIKGYSAYSINMNNSEIFEEIRSCYAQTSHTTNYSGGYPEYYSGTLERFYSNHGKSIVAHMVYGTSGVNSGFVNSVSPLSVLSVYGIDVQYNGGDASTGGHAVLYTGCYAYTTTYREKTWGVFYKTVSKNFDTYIICDGWHNSSSGGIGSQMQMVVFADDANVKVTMIDDLFENILA